MMSAYCATALDDVDTIELEYVDAILISHSQSLITLPYLTDVKKYFGKVLAPAPLVQFGKVLIDDLFAHSEFISSNVMDSVEKRIHDSSRWLPRYTKEQASSAMSKVQALAYNQYVDFFGLVKVKCASAGYEIGSCNWIMKTDYEKIAYISRSSLYPSFALPLDFSDFRDVDVLIVGAVNTSNSLPFDVALQRFKTITVIVLVQTLARGGHVLIPTMPSGLIYNLLEAVEAAKSEFDGKIIEAFDQPVCGDDDCVKSSRGTSTTSTHIGGTSLIGRVGESPSYFISAAAKASLVYVNAFVEWLVSEKQIKTSDPRLPFSFDERINKDRLMVLNSLHSSPNVWASNPIVLFSGHPSCRVGSAVHLIRALSLGVGRQRPQSGQAQIQQWFNLNALILVQSDEFWYVLPPLCNCYYLKNKINRFKNYIELTLSFSKYKDEHECLKSLLQPLGNFGEFTSTNDTILGVPVCRLGVGLTAYWLPLRFDISIDQLPTLLKKCGAPKQALILPSEVISRATSPLPPEYLGIDCGQSLNVKLLTPEFLHVHVNMEIVNPKYIVNFTANSFPDGVDNEKDPRKVSRSSGNVPSKPSVSLIQGRLFFRDGKYRLEPLKREITGNGGRSSSRSPQTPPKRSASPSLKFALKLGAHRLLLAPKEAISPLREFANRVVKQLTVFGVTGAQVIAQNGTNCSAANMELMKSFADRYRRLNKRLSVCSMPTLEENVDTILIVFPNSTTSILLTEKGTFITCTDEGTRVAIRSAILASSPKMVTLPCDNQLEAILEREHEMLEQARQQLMHDRQAFHMEVIKTMESQARVLVQQQQQPQTPQAIQTAPPPPPNVSLQQIRSQASLQQQQFRAPPYIQQQSGGPPQLRPAPSTMMISSGGGLPRPPELAPMMSQQAPLPPTNTGMPPMTGPPKLAPSVNATKMADGDESGEKESVGQEEIKKPIEQQEAVARPQGPAEIIAQQPSASTSDQQVGEETITEVQKVGQVEEQDNGDGDEGEDAEGMEEDDDDDDES
ncbi:unnamed protein product [Rodentolepis nana]|uniref:Beta-Casp domain-containing protein n=1 Tax=Rodentolepis nana TaxID=102285 RepID=A0A0R3TKY7_RODNA|nr:unnamed protein product [Rodentolepis nana]